jgi:site-specific DNA-methyltransferase (adenine-specific)
MNVHFSSKTDDWATPQALFDSIDQQYHFDLDPAASQANHKTPQWYGLDHEDESRRDGLMAEWEGLRVWLNPPYGRTIGQWVKKAADHHAQGNLVVLLLPARTDTKWFHDYIIDKDVQFLRGRLKFGAAINSAPFPSMIVVMK